MLYDLLVLGGNAYQYLGVNFTQDEARSAIEEGMNIWLSSQKLEVPIHQNHDAYCTSGTSSYIQWLNCRAHGS